MNVTVYHYEAFSIQPGKGNPAGVVLDGGAYTDLDMQAIAHQVGFNETVFVLPSHRADVRLKYFTPGHEINLCGHATMAALYALKTRGFLSDSNAIFIETNVGVLPIAIEIVDGVIYITMQQDQPKFLPFHGDTSALAVSMGLREEDLDETLPIVYGSTGTWTLLIPIKQLEAFKQMNPRNEQFPDILTENPRSSIHPFCFETYDPGASMHARHFSSPYSGTVEDPVTGTASGVMGAYYLTYINPEANSLECVIEQGQEMGKDGTISVKIDKNRQGMTVSITGTANLVKPMEVVIPHD